MPVFFMQHNQHIVCPVFHQFSLIWTLEHHAPGSSLTCSLAVIRLWHMRRFQSRYKNENVKLIIICLLNTVDLMVNRFYCVSQYSSSHILMVEKERRGRRWTRFCTGIPIKTLNSAILSCLLPIFHKKTSWSRDKVINPVQTCVGIHTRRLWQECRSVCTDEINAKTIKSHLHNTTRIIYRICANTIVCLSSAARSSATPDQRTPSTLNLSFIT